MVASVAVVGKVVNGFSVGSGETVIGGNVRIIGVYGISVGGDGYGVVVDVAEAFVVVVGVSVLEPDGPAKKFISSINHFVFVDWPVCGKFFKMIVLNCWTAKKLKLLYRLLCSRTKLFGQIVEFFRKLFVNNDMFSSRLRPNVNGII